MQVELKVNGKTVQAEISEEQAKILGLVTDKPKTGYERVEKGSTYFYNYSSDDTDNDIDKKDMVDQEYYNNANYYSDKMIAENNARADKLLRCLRRWQALNDKAITKKDWKDKSLTKYLIIYDYDSNVISPSRVWWMRGTNNIYFKSREKAEEAIEVFKDELLWYFTEYVQRLDEVQNG